MVYRCILPDRLSHIGKKVLEDQYDTDQLQKLNSDGYNIYFFPNSPSIHTPNEPVNGHHIDKFDFVFVDMDLKDGVFKTKDEFVKSLSIPPSLIVDSGNGVHAYWEVQDLDAISFLRLQRRLARTFKTDLAVSKICQLMRVPGYLNTKKDPATLCSVISETGIIYTCEGLDKQLPIITKEDEAYCQQHYNRTYNINSDLEKVDEKLPLKFGTLIQENKEVKDIWSGNTEDRSRSDFRLAHILFANGFTKQEAISVLVNCAKALSRAPAHRLSYALNIIDQIWTFEEAKDKNSLTMSSSVKDILERPIQELKGKRLPCFRYLDDTIHGFRLGQIIGLVAGSGVGKTAVALNMFLGFVQNNPDYDHFFIPLEQPEQEIADRWRTLCGDQVHLHEKVQVLSNYDADGKYRHLSLKTIKEYILRYQEVTKRKVGCVVIDHIGVLDQDNRNGESQKLMDICKQMKAFAQETNTMLVMQSQAPREKAGSGDLELDKDAAYGTVYFESFCDYLITMWQPLKRCYSETGCPHVTAFKFCKIRHKKANKDEIQEDVRYLLFFDPDTEKLRPLTDQEYKSFQFFNNKATNKRKTDRKTDVLEYKSVKWETESNEVSKPSSDNGLNWVDETKRVH